MANLIIRIGTRNSPLARWQADWVARQLTDAGHKIELVPIVTEADTSSQPIADFGTPGVFTKQLELALIDGRVDLAVHSLKDLPTELTPGLTIAAVPKREQVADVLISRDGATLDRLPSGATVGTGSLRRRAQLLHVRGDLQMCDIRGNVDTRLKKLREGQFDAVVLALAGLKRLELDGQITQVLPAEIMLPAIGQGALAIQTRTNDQAVQNVLRSIDDPPTHQAVIAERTLLAELQGGCLAPIAAWCRPAGPNQLELSAAVLSADGRKKLVASQTGTIDTAQALGQQVAHELLAAGAAELVAAARR